MASTLDIALSEFLSETRVTEQNSKLTQLLHSYLASLVDNLTSPVPFTSSDPHSVLDILVQHLLARFTSTFVENVSSTSHSSTLERKDLLNFLQQEESLLLMATIQHLSMQVDSAHPELVELLIVVLRTLTARAGYLVVKDDLYLGFLPIYASSQTSGHNKQDLKHKQSGPWPLQSQAHSSIPVIGPYVSERMSKTYAKHQSLSSDVTEDSLHLLLLAIVEGLTYQFRPKNNNQVSASIRSVSNLTALLEDLLELWIKVRTGQPLVLNREATSELMELEQPNGFLCSNLLYRLVLRVWLTLTQNTFSYLAMSSSTTNLQSLMSRPIAMVTDASLNLNKDWLFLGHTSLDSEFSFTFLESLFASIAAINVFASNPNVSAESFLKVLQVSLSTESQELLIYLCSKLQSLPQSGGSMSDSVITSIHLLLCHFTREMITLSDHIHTSQQAAKSLLLQQQQDGGTAPPSTNYSLERAMLFDKMEQRLCKISQSLLSIFDNVPTIQLLSLQLLAQTGLDKVGIINDFLPRVSHSSVWTMPEVLDLYLELLEKAWFQLSHEYTGSAEFWSKVSHYSTPLIQGTAETVLQVTYHLLFLFSHQSNHLRSALTQHILLQCHQKMMDDFQKVYATNFFSQEHSKTHIYQVEFGIEEENVYHQYLKLLQKMAAHPSSLLPFLEDPHHIFLLFLLLPIPRFRSNALSVFKAVLTTLSTPWEASITHTNKLTNNQIHYHLVNSLLRIAYEFKEGGHIVQQCQQMSTGGMSIGCLDIRQVDGVHRNIQECLECSKISFLVSSPVIEHLQLVADVWEVLAVTVETCSPLLHIMNNNQIWDVIQVLSPSLASLLERLQTWKTSGNSDPDDADDPDMLRNLQETSVSLLCHLLGMAMTMCRLKEDPLKVLELHCKEVHSFLIDSRLCSISNSASYIAMLMKGACFFSPEPERSSQTREGGRRRRSVTDDGRQKQRHSSVVSSKQSKIRPISLSVNGKANSKPARQNSSLLVKSPISGLRQLFPLLINNADGESDASGYEGDIEFWSQRWWEGSQRYNLEEEEEEEGLVAGVGTSSLTSPVTSSVRAPLGVKKRIWMESPIWLCIELLKECLEDKETAEKCESCLELFLAYLLCLLKADKYNLALLAGKSMLGVLLDSFAPMFDSKTEKSKSCWLILCQVSELLATYQISQSDIQKLFMKLQKTPSHLEQLALLLHKVAETTHSSNQPSAYLHFSYSRPTSELDSNSMLVLPNPHPSGLEPCTISLWLSISKYPLKAFLHLFTLYTGGVYLQVWACACSGDIIFNFTNDKHSMCTENTSSNISSIIVGTALTHNNTFHHVFVSLKAVSGRTTQYCIVLVVDGCDVYEYQVNLPTALCRQNREGSCYIAGGVVSSHTKEKHIHLVNADQTQLSWKLGSMHIFEGFSSSSLAILLYQLGPECAPSSINNHSEANGRGLLPNYIEVTTTDSTIVTHGAVSDSKMALQRPLLSYTAHHAQVVYLTIIKAFDGEDIDSDHTQHIEVPSVHQLQWETGNSVSRPQILDILQDCTGLEQLVYLYAKTVSEGCSEQAQCAALSVISLAAGHSPYSKLQFRQIGGINLIQQVLRTSKASLTMDIAGVFLDWCCGRDWAEVFNLEVLEHILLDWHIWHKALEHVWCSLLQHLEDLLSPTNPHAENNLIQFQSIDAIIKILSIGKEQSLYNRPPFEGKVAMMLVRLVKLLIGDPPMLDCLKYVWDHLLQPDLNTVNIIRGGTAHLDATASFLDANHIANTANSARLSVSTLGSISVSRLLDEWNQDDTDSDSEPEVLNMEFDIQSRDGRLPDSSYPEEEAWLTWTDITGLPFLNEGESNNTITINLETGLLSVIRKVICLLPDIKVKQVLGPILDQESIVVMANNSSVIIRTAVVRLLDEFFRRAGDSSQANFLHVKGFNLLAMQLKQFTVSSELMSALFSIVVGQEINLQSDTSINFHIPRNLSRFQLHAVNPVLVCAVNTLSQPALCHATLCILRELFEMTKGMPAFMLNNGLFKMLVQMIALTPETSSLSREQRQLIINDLLNFCNLIVIFTLSSDQEEVFRNLEGFLVCLRHCSNEVKKTKGPQSLTFVYLEQFICLILAKSLLFFSSGVDTSSTAAGGGGGGGGGATGGRTMEVGEFTPTLESCQQVAGQTDLMNRFVLVCSMTVDWIVHGMEPLTSDHAQLFKEGVTIPKLITYDRKTQLVNVSAGLIRFTVQYFYRALLIIIKKNTTTGFDSSPYRFFINSRTHLNEAFARLFGYLLSSVHAPQMRAEILREVWSLEESQDLLHLLLSSQYKKLLCSRLVVAIVDLMQSVSIHMDGRLITACSEVFDVVCSTGATRLKQPMTLSTLLNLREEENTRTRQKTETIMDEFRNTDQRWVERVESGEKDFEHNLKSQYQKLVEKSRNHSRAVSNASAEMTERVFERQAQLRKSFIDLIEYSGMMEKEALQRWRKIIHTNTHARALWSADERRPLCWQLDPTEGPSRVRRRLITSPRTIDEKFLLEEAKSKNYEFNGQSPLSFIFEDTAYDGTRGMSHKIVRQKGEEIIGNHPQRCKCISPDGCCDGNLIVSNICCHFVGDEPLDTANISKVIPCDDKAQMFSWRHSDVVEIHRRRYMLKDNALEIFLINGVTTLLAFETTRERDMVHGALLELEMPSLVDSGEADTGKLKAVTLSWQQGEITNFEYLMELNKLAGRTFNDLMQYPVFPFILSDYKSKELKLGSSEVYRKLHLPISVQDENKRQKYVETYRYLEMEVTTQGSAIPGMSTSKPYHYGSHYSNSGIVLHFLVRIPPFTNMFLDFQGKSFDIADRSFHNMATTWWLSSSESATDVKELIPEFFYFPEFLVNNERFNLGVKQSGEAVDSVNLPPWANGDPRLFVLKHRQALESEHVSQNLHEWIDLVFGCKQTGKPAVNAINVFHPATYYGADGIEIDSIQDSTQQEALKTMVKTYGQMPLQLFRDAHPPRSKPTVRTTLLIRFGFAAIKKLTSTTSYQLKIVNPIILHYMKILRPKVTGDCEFIGKSQSPGHKITSSLPSQFSPEKIACMISGEVVVTELDAAFFPSSLQTPHSGLLVTWGHWDNTLEVLSVGSEQPMVKLHHPPLDRVSCCQCVCNGQMLVSAGTAGVVSFWELINNNKQPLAYSGKVHRLKGHEGPITCLVACKPYSIVVSGSTDCTCIIWDINRLCYVNTLPGHEGPINCIAVSPTLGDIATVCMEKRREGYPGSPIKPPQMCILTLWTINGRLVKQIKTDVQILSLCYTSAPEGVYINTLITGMADGTIRLLNSWDLSLVSELKCPSKDPNPTLSLAVSSCSTKLYAGYSNRNMVTWVKPVSVEPEENGEYVVVPSFVPVPPIQPSTMEKSAQSTASMLRYF